MTIWLPKLEGRPGPRYRALAEAIAAGIGDGSLPNGTRLPPQRDLAHALAVTVGTVGRAYALVEQQGLVTGEVGRGTYVRASATPELANPLVDGADELIKLTVNAPPQASMRGLIAEQLAALAADAGRFAELFAYAPKRGLPEHRAAAAAWLASLDLAAPAEQMLITGGAQQGLAVSLSGLASPGEAIMIEALAYHGIREVAHRLGLVCHGLALDDEGVTPEALAATAAASGAKVVVLNPTLHNPTTGSMSLARRQAIVALARRHDLAIIEDDVYGRLPEERAPPIATLAPERTIYVTSASKSVAPGLRFGMVLAPEAYFDRLADAQHDLFLACPPVLAELFRRWQENGTADRLAERQRQEAGVRQALAHEVLGACDYRISPGSTHLWLPLPAPWRTTEFVAAVRAAGVVIDPGFAFALERASAPHAVRVSLSAAANLERLRRALTIIVETLDRPPGRRHDMI